MTNSISHTPSLITTLPPRVRVNGFNWTLWNTDEFANSPSYMIEQRHSWAQLKPADVVNALSLGQATVLPAHDWQANAPQTQWGAI